MLRACCCIKVSHHESQHELKDKTTQLDIFFVFYFEVKLGGMRVIPTKRFIIFTICRCTLQKARAWNMKHGSQQETIAVDGDVIRFREKKTVLSTIFLLLHLLIFLCSLWEMMSIKGNGRSEWIEMVFFFFYWYFWDCYWMMERKE